MPTVLLRMGDLTIYTYSVWMALAVIGGLGLAWLQARRIGISTDLLSDAAVLALLGGVIGARLEYVLLNLEYFREQPAAALRLWQGGLALHGGLWLGLLFLLGYAHARRIRFWVLADVLALGMSLGTVLGWMACLYGGCAYGRPGFGPLYFVWYDTFGVSASRFAVQPLGAALSLALCVALILLALRRRPPGSVLLLYLGISGLIQLGLGFGRADETLHWFGRRADQWLNLLQVVLSGSMVAYLLTRSRVGPPPTTVEPK